ncbi:MAG: YhgE/Pip family protein [Coriobacteriales bacterium]
MNNVLRILRRDLVRLAKVPQSWVVLFFLLFLPSLYTWVNVTGFWNPYDNVRNLRVCVVNEDQGAESSVLGSVDLGAQLVDQLSADTQLGWVFTTYDEAMLELRRGEAFAAFVIPSDFSSRIAGLAEGELGQVPVDYYVNEKLGPLSPKVTDAGSATLGATINDTFVSTASQVVLEMFQARLGATLDDAASAQQSAVASLGEAQAGAGGARRSLEELAKLSDETAETLRSASRALDAGGPRLKALQQELEHAARLNEDAGARLSSSLAELNGTLDKGSALISKTSSEVSLAMAELAPAVSAAQAQLERALVSAGALAQSSARTAAQLREAAQAMPEGPQREGLLALAAQLEEQASNTASLVEDLQKAEIAAGELYGVLSDSSALASGQEALSSIDAFRAATMQGLTGPAGVGGAKTTAALGDLQAAAASLELLLGQMRAGLAQATLSLEALSKMIRESDGVLEDVQAQLAGFQSDVQAFKVSAAVSALFGQEGVDPEEAAAFLATPAQLRSHVLYPACSYGAGMAPLFMNLTMWMGVFMLVILLRLEVDAEGIPGVTASQRYIGRGLLLAIIAIAQAVICCTGCFAIGLSVASIPLFYLTAACTSLAYLSIQYALSTTLQHVGRGLCIMLALVQVPAATGMYPVEMTTAFFQSTYRLFPFTYGINALREVICGFYGTLWLQHMAALLLFFAAFLLVGLVLRPRMVNLNHLFANQIEECGLVNGEPMMLPKRPLRLARVLLVLSGSDSKRFSLDESIIRFARLYPKLKLVEGAVGQLEPDARVCKAERPQRAALSGILPWGGVRNRQAARRRVTSAPGCPRADRRGRGCG